MFCAVTELASKVDRQSIGALVTLSPSATIVPVIGITDYAARSEHLVTVACLEHHECYQATIVSAVEPEIPIRAPMPVHI